MSREQSVAEQLREIADFLDGSAPFDGRWFGDDPPRDEHGRVLTFWWRKHLRVRVDAAIAALTASPQAAPEGGEPEVIACELEGFGSVSAPGIRAMCQRAADTIRRLASPQVQGVEAVAWQYRTPKLLSDGWHPWQQCDRELFDELTEHGSYAGRPVQVRALYATPQRAPGVTEEMARCPLCGVSGLHACTGQPIKPWTEQDKRDLVAAMQRIEERERAAPVSAVGADDCVKCGKSNRLNCNDECWNCGALLASGPSGADGWKWVPIEPTDAMTDAGGDVSAPSNAYHHSDIDIGGAAAREVWNAMLAAAPTAQDQGEGK